MTLGVPMKDKNAYDCISVYLIIFIQVGIDIMASEKYKNEKPFLISFHESKLRPFNLAGREVHLQGPNHDLDFSYGNFKGSPT